MDLGTIWASVGLKTAPLAAGVAQAKGMMTGLDASLSTGVAGGAKKAEASLAGIGKQLAIIPGPAGKAAGSLNNLFASMGTGGQIMMGVAAMALIAGGLFKIADAAAEVQKIDAQTNAVIASTGGVANVSAGHVDELANKLRNISGVDDEVVKSGENIMLTFRGVQNIGKEKIFDQAVTSSLDLSIALGKDLNDSAIKVGKALQDPVRGLTALRRYGVAFSAEQETMIKKMVATGDVMGAQKVILAELNAEFGGSAAALGDTFGGQLEKAKSLLHDFMEEAGKPVLGPLTGSLQGLSSVLQGMSAIKLPQIAMWAYTATNPLLLLGATIDGIQKKFGKGEMAKGSLDFSGAKKDIAGIVAEIVKVKGENVVIHTETATANVQKLKAALEKATGKKITIETTGAGNAVDDLDKKVQQLDQDVKDAVDDITPGMKQIEDILALKGVTFVTPKVLKPLIVDLSSERPIVREAAEKTMGELVDAVGRSDPLVREKASAIKESITNAIEECPAGERTDKKMAEIALSVLAAQGSTTPAMQALMAALQAVIDGSQPVITPVVDTSSALASFVSFCQHPWQTIIQGVYQGPPGGIPGQGGGGRGASGGGGGLAGAQTALTSTFGAFINQMDAAPILEVENAINGLTTADWGLINTQQAGDRAFNTRQKQLEKQALEAEVNGNKDEAERVRGAAAAEAKVHDLDMINRELNATNKTNKESIGIWRNANAAYDLATAGLTKYETRLKAAQTAIDKYNVALQASEDRASKAQAAIDKLSSMKLLGEGAAADKAYEMDEKSKNLQLQIMKAEDAHNYALAAKLTLEKEANDRKKEEADLQSAVDDKTGLSLDDQHRKLEKLLDPLKGQEKSYKEIRKQIKAAQDTLAKEAITQSKIKNHIDQQTRSMKLLQNQYDAAKLKVDAFKKQIDDLASFFVSKYGDMKNAVTDLNNAIGGGGTIPSYQAGIGYVPATGLAVVHKGEQITPALRPMQVHTTSDTQVTIPLYLDGKVLAKTVTKIQGGNASAYSMSGGRY